MLKVVRWDDDNFTHSPLCIVTIVTLDHIITTVTLVQLLPLLLFLDLLFFWLSLTSLPMITSSSLMSVCSVDAK
jgi:hypothetical protein